MTPNQDHTDNDTDEEVGLELDESGKHRFNHAATTYGAVIYGGPPEVRINEITTRLTDPLVAIDCREINSGDEFVRTAIKNASPDEKAPKEEAHIGLIDLRRKVNNTESSLAVLEFDALSYDTQKEIAQMMKSLAETVESDDIMLGYTTSIGERVSRAERDLSMRIKEFQGGPVVDTYGPLGNLSEGDTIKTSARETPMTVTTIEHHEYRFPKVIAENQYGEYWLEAYGENDIKMTASNEVIHDVTVEKISD